MALVVKDRVQEVTTTTGTGTLTLGGAFLGFQTFAVIGNDNTTYYAVADSVTGDYEVGIGTYTSSGTTLSRTTVLESSNSGSLVNFAVGSKSVFCTYPAERAVYLDSAGSAVTLLDIGTLGASTANITTANITSGTISTTPVNNTDIVNKQYVDAIATNASNITTGTLGTSRLSGSYTGITGTGALAAGSLATGFTAVSAPLGGTGQSSYAVGDLLYADTTTSLAKLADVAVGNALISGGISSAPSWGKIGLATHISGTLPILNGGTGQTTQTAAFNALSPTTTKGDLVVSNGTNNIRLPVGANTFVLTADSGEPSGLIWASGGAGGGLSQAQALKLVSLRL